MYYQEVTPVIVGNYVIWLMLSLLLPLQALFAYPSLLTN